MLIGLFAVALGACWIVRGSRTKRLRDAVELERTQQGELNRLKKENKRLAAAQPATDELQALRGDHEAVERLRGELTELRTPNSNVDSTTIRRSSRDGIAGADHDAGRVEERGLRDSGGGIGDGVVGGGWWRY